MSMQRLDSSNAICIFCPRPYLPSFKVSFVGVDTFTRAKFFVAKVGLDRMNEFLQEVGHFEYPILFRGLTCLQTELLDEYTLERSVSLQPAPEPSEVEANEIGIRQTSFTWANEETDGDVTPSRRRFMLRIDDEVFFKKGCINLVIGQTGTGKTSLLMALLGEA